MQTEYTKTDIEAAVAVIEQYEREVGAYRDHLSLADRIRIMVEERPNKKKLRAKLDEANRINFDLVRKNRDLERRVFGMDGHALEALDKVGAVLRGYERDRINAMLSGSAPAAEPATVQPDDVDYRKGQ